VTDQPESVSITIGREVPVDQREELVGVFAEYFDLLPSGRKLSPEWIEIIGVAKDIGALAGTANALIALAASVNRWRKKVRDAKHVPRVQLKHSGGQELDLASATDADVEEWIGVTPRPRGNLSNSD
jgi:hypothetical protein